MAEQPSVFLNWQAFQEVASELKTKSKLGFRETVISFSLYLFTNLQQKIIHCITIYHIK